MPQPEELLTLTKWIKFRDKLQESLDWQVDYGQHYNPIAVMLWDVKKLIERLEKQMTESNQPDESLGQAISQIKEGEKIIRNSIFDGCTYELEMKKTAINLFYVFDQSRTFVAAIPTTGWYPEKMSSNPTQD